MAQTQSSEGIARTRTLAIDVGGTGLKASIVDDSGRLLTDRARIDTPVGALLLAATTVGLASGKPGNFVGKRACRGGSGRLTIGAWHLLVALDQVSRQHPRRASNHVRTRRHE